MYDGYLNGIFFWLPGGGVIGITGGGSSQNAANEIAIAVNDKRIFGSFDIWIFGFVTTNLDKNPEIFTPAE
jgi:hypothetical protein